MEQTTFVESSVQAAMQGFVCVAINIETNSALARQYGLYRVPSVYFLNKDGQPLDRAIGFKPPELFITYLNRVATADGKLPVGVQSIAELLKQPAPNRIAHGFTFKRDDATSVFLAGDFNDWRFTELPLMRGDGGVWSLTLYLPEGAYQYKYYVPDTREYLSDPGNPYWRPDPFGGHNSIAVVGKPLVGPIVDGTKVTFYYYDKDAKSVEIAGDFTEWKTMAMFSNLKGSWGVILNLTPGPHEYKYIVDGQWVLDPHNLSTQKSGMGTENSLIEVK